MTDFIGRPGAERPRAGPEAPESEGAYAPVFQAPVPGAGDARVGFVLGLGRALHMYGYPAHRLEDVMSLVARRLGLEAQFFSQPTSIFAAFGAQNAQRTHLIRVEPGEVHLEKLVAVDQVAGNVLRGTLDPAGGAARIEAIAAAPARYGAAITAAAFGLSSAASARFLGGGAREVVIAAGTGLAVGALALVTQRAPAARRVFEPLAAFTASALATAASLVLGPCSVYVATLAGVIVLLPGLALTTAMTELSTRHLASGTARLSGALMLFLAIAFGVAMGSKVVGVALGAPHIADPRELAPWTEWVALALAPVSLTVLFRAPPAELPWIWVTGVLAFAGGRMGARMLGPELGIFVGALTAGIASNLYARWRDRPSPVTLVPAVILLVPGSIGFRGLALLLERHVVVGVESAFRMVIMLSALVGGLLIANLVTPGGRSGDREG
jgi:uncharacterized membrane protein YjjP (DUF1212 family)